MQAEELLYSIAKGDANALAKLYELFKNKVYNTALVYLHNVEEAEEVLQDVFLEVFNNAKNFKGNAAPSTWIYRITINKCIDKVRYRSRRKRFAFITSIFSKETGELVHDSPTPDHPGVIAEHKEQSKALFAAIDQLPDNQRAAFVLKQVEGLSQKEVAAVMDMSEKAVESLLQRAKGNLRKALGDIWERSKGK